ncbi:disease resistance protein RPM1-like [Oryza brachyantha]|uniref:NB-ARC domain-containing protein n=1 Tax=Oryza brachyantha TaxID=4533 RepID=J3KUF8_ORYBR|nr:disease resistance protein RPM1-like [Oryza brachyantha]XP_015698928.1 disease resistance protein RPM1-like [Oryza brachyantha]XP_015698929.1 disease resistance protein RPM1-like [Oryza brachyantha]XP_015698930.1 disease resistance protein RPM1-like [Oryza brachyantha]XP_015698931.1 disease resistance protein RPM1-like [Oryza brachyantha]XP_015698933.1 disease resistance protein RPM1-like [Oryza brachyantha]XP_040383992.1 disease resistance protein RPM1-like [Oryza brachyantha]
MAEAAVVQALIKIGTTFGDAALQPLKDIIKKEVALLQELPELAKSIGRELDMINSFLMQVRAKIHSTDNEVLKRWVVRVRQVAYHVEDIIDEYSYNVALLQEESYLSRMMRATYYGTTFHGIATGLKDVDSEIKQLSGMKTKYAEYFSELHSNTSANTQAHLCRDSSLHMIKEGIVGMTEEIELLNSWLAPNDPTRAVLSVWGLFGLGKTTLVRKVYESMKEQKSFQCYSWIEVPHEYNNDVTLRQLIRDLAQEQSQVSANLDSMYGSQLVDILCDVLSDKRYLIVLDNVWDADAFRGISSFLIDNRNASRIIITTRTSDVASLAQDKYKLKLKPLGDDDAMALFCRRAFHNDNMECPSHLKDLCKQIVKKCGGLPSAIYAIGNVLAVREKTEVAWKIMNDQFHCMLEDNPGLGEVRSALSVSILFLPRHLKNCFLYCSLFPQNYRLSRESLVKLWTAEGFITKRGNSTLEEVADEYLMELIRGSLLQLLETDEIGRVAFCKMHDIVRDLALSYSRKEMFGLSEGDLQTDQKEDVRRLSISKGNKNVGPSLDFPRLRTFIATNGAAESDLLNSLIPKSKYLAVLELQDSPINIIPANIADLFNLRYLGLRRTNVKSLPKSIEKLHNLETLDLKYTGIDELPKEICKLKKLRHLFADKIIASRSVFRYFKGMQLPQGFSHMDEIQTLETVEATKDSIELLGKLIALRTLWVENVHRADCTKLFLSLSTMVNLSSLLISASNDHEALDFDAFNPSEMNLQKLIIRGCLDNDTFGKPVFSKHGSHIKYLSLSSSRIGNDPFPLLAENMPNLIYLSIRKWCCAEEVALRAGKFPRLTTLFLGDMKQVRSIVIEQSAVGSLEALYLVSLTAMAAVPSGLELVASLRKLTVWGQSDEFKLEWKRENWESKLHHVPEIRV